VCIIDLDQKAKRLEAQDMEATFRYSLQVLQIAFCSRLTFGEQ